MALLKLVYIPDPRLRTVCEPITDFADPNLQTLIDDMFETMYQVRGVGLAANQIGICKSLAVIDVSDDKTQPMCIINPEIIELTGAEKMQEGCLSVPGCYETVTRPTYIKVRAYDRHGKQFEIEGEDLLAECLHHEIDHLNGKLYIDQLSALKRERVKDKVSKYLKMKERHAKK